MALKGESNMLQSSRLQGSLKFSTVQVDLLQSMQDDSSASTAEQLTDIDYLKGQLAADKSHFATKLGSISTALCDVVDDFSLLQLCPLSIEDHKAVKRVMELVDQANGYSLSGLAGRNPYDFHGTEVALGSKTHLWATDPSL